MVVSDTEIILCILTHIANEKNILNFLETRVLTVGEDKNIKWEKERKIFIILNWRYELMIF